MQFQKRYSFLPAITCTDGQWQLFHRYFKGKDCRFLPLLIAGLLLVSKFFSPLAAQSTDLRPTSIKQLYQLEYSDEPDDQPLRPEQFTIGISALPHWFWNIPASTHQTSYAIGISDPLPDDSAKAAHQAMARGVLQLHLLHHAEITGVSDLFNTDLQNKYEELYRFQTNSELEGSYSKVDSFTTRYGEKMYLIQLKTTKKISTSLYSNVEIYRSYSKVNSGWCGTSKVHCTWQFDTVSLSYDCTQNENQVEIISLINNDTIPITGYRYEYHPPLDVCSNDTTVVKLHRRGLWSGYFDAFCEGLQTVATNVESKINSVDTMHNNEKGVTDIRMLKRSIVKQTLQLSIQRINNIYNQLKIDIVISNKTS